MILTFTQHWFSFSFCWFLLNSNWQDFSDSRDADDARHSLNGREVDGSRLIVEFAKGVSTLTAYLLLYFSYPLHVKYLYMRRLVYNLEVVPRGASQN